MCRQRAEESIWALIKRELKQLITKELPNTLKVWEAPLLAVSHPLVLRAVV